MADIGIIIIFYFWNAGKSNKTNPNGLTVISITFTRIESSNAKPSELKINEIKASSNKLRILLISQKLLYLLKIYSQNFEYQFQG